jgi:hypothetical protein
MEHEARGQAGDEAEMSGHFHNPELGVRGGTFFGKYSPLEAGISERGYMIIQYYTRI